MSLFTFDVMMPLILLKSNELDFVPEAIRIDRFNQQQLVEIRASC